MESASQHQPLPGLAWLCLVLASFIAILSPVQAYTTLPTLRGLTIRHPDGRVWRSDPATAPSNMVGEFTIRLNSGTPLVFDIYNGTDVHGYSNGRIALFANGTRSLAVRHYYNYMFMFNLPPNNYLYAYQLIPSPANSPTDFQMYNDYGVYVGYDTASDTVFCVSSGDSRRVTWKITPLQCSAGTFNNGSSCSPCPPGTFKAATGFAASCTPCSVNTYTNTSSATSCASCPTNSTTLGQTGSNTCHCNAGFFGDGLSSCAPCPAGTAKNATGNGPQSSVCQIVPTFPSPTTSNVATSTLIQSIASVQTTVTQVVPTATTSIIMTSNSSENQTVSIILATGISSTSSETSVSSASTTYSAPMTTSPATCQPTDPEASTTNIALIAGIASGSCLLGLLGASSFFLFLRRRQVSKPQMDPTDATSAMQGTPMNMYGLGQAWTSVQRPLPKAAALGTDASMMANASMTNGIIGIGTARIPGATTMIRQFGVPATQRMSAYQKFTTT